MNILKTIRAGMSTFRPGQETALLDHAELYPEQLDFFRLLDTGCISAVPDASTLTPEGRAERRRLKAEEDEARIKAANEAAELEKEAVQAVIRQAVERANVRREQDLKDAIVETKVNTGANIEE